ncbi:TPA: hypothetical protein TXN45_000823 [Streptococcus suis]|nr:hypothetical protein [Streptococcus suis]
MNLQVQFFQNDVIKAIKGGVYQISLQKDDGERRVLYIGESFSMLIRCAQHLYQLRKYPEYLGMTTETLRDQNLILMFEILELEEAMGIKRKKEKKKRSTLKSIGPCYRVDLVIVCYPFLEKKKRWLIFWKYR